jgi:pimeloyl-ACP methyl ester carboxylesterase
MEIAIQSMECISARFAAMPMSEAQLRLDLHRRTLGLPQLQLSYLEWNPGGEPLLLLHGLADSGAVWISLAEDLGDRYHCIAPDLRGHGDSDKPDRGYRCQDIIADLDALMDRLGWSEAHVVAHSWSAKVASVWARQQPERFRSLVLVDPFFIDRLPGWMTFTFPLLYRVLPFLKLVGSFDSYEQAKEQAQQLKQYRGWSEFQEMVFQASLEQKPNGTWKSKFVKQARNEIFEDVMQVAGLTEPLDVRTLFLQPEAGLNRTAWQLMPYRTYFQNLEIRKIPGNHWAFLVEPKVFNQTVAAFLVDVICGSKT